MSKAEGKFHVPVYKRLLSYLYPVRVSRVSGSFTPDLELVLYENRWQLVTGDTLYSDGRKYRPLELAFGVLRGSLPPRPEMLLLGTGLASAVYILDHMGLRPYATLIDTDPAILELAGRLLPERLRSDTRFCSESAETYMKRNDTGYDLVVADVFSGRDVPGFVTSDAFLSDCRRSIRPGGFFILNYIPVSLASLEQLCALMDKKFPGYKMHVSGINRIFTAEVTSPAGMQK